MREGQGRKTKRMGLIALFGFLGIVLLFPQARDGGLSAEVASQQTLQYETGVTLKLLQVYVTDKKGNPLTDLTVDDFEVNDDGKVVPITHFEKHFFGESEESIETAVPATQMNRKFILFFDFAFMDQKGMTRAKDAALHFMDTEILPSDEIGLFTYTAMRGLTLHEYFSLDHQKIRQIIDGFGLKHVAGRAESLTNYLYTMDLDEDILDTTGLGETTESEDEAFFDNLARQQTGRILDSGQGQRYIDQIRQLVRTFTQLAKVLRFSPGYKNIIYLSGGMARQVLYGKAGGYVMGNWQTADQYVQEMAAYESSQGDQGVTDEFSQALKELDASNCPVFALDVSRVRGDVDAGSRGGIDRSTRDFDGEDSLRQIAKETNGKFYGSTVDYKTAIKDIKKVTGAYYVLGYTLDDVRDGKYHKIKVKTNRKGAKVVSQGGYYNPKSYKELSSFEKLLYITDMALSDNPQFDIPAEIPVVTMPVLVKGWMQLAAYANIPSEISRDILGNKSEAYLLIIDDKGILVSIRRLPLPAARQDKDIYYPVFLSPIQPGNFTFRIVVRNAETGKGARGVSSLMVPQSSPQPLWLDPPLLLISDAKGLDIGQAPDATLSNLYSYDSDDYRPLVGEISRERGKFYAALRCTSTMASEIDFSAAFVDPNSSSRTEIPLTVIGEKKDGSLSTFFMELTAENIEPGAYHLVFVAKEKDGQGSAVSNIALSVK